MIFNYLYFDPIRFRTPIYIDSNNNVSSDLSPLLSDNLFKKINRLYFSQRKKKYPYFYYCGTHDIPQLKEFSKIKSYRFFKKMERIEFYFFEPLTHYLKNVNYNYIPHILRCNNETYDLENLRAKELDSISEWAYENNLKNITVYCTEYQSDKFYKNIYENLELKHLDLLSFTISKNITEKKFHYFEKKLDLSKISKKFIFPSWRYDPVRHFLISFMVNKDIHLDSHMSFYFNLSNETMIKKMWFNNIEFNFKFSNFFNTILEGNEKLHSILPLTFDAVNPKTIDDDRVYPNNDGVSNLIKTHRPESFYEEAAVSIVAESRFAQPWPNISEKTINSIMMLKPFVLIAAPGTLSMLKEMGFKTFSDFWDESYDEIFHNDERIVAICKTIEQISKFSLTELIELNKEMEPILKHNLRNLENLEKFYKKYNKI